MAGFQVGGFASGLGKGLEAGAALKDRQEKRAAQAAVARAVLASQTPQGLPRDPGMSMPGQGPQGLPMDPGMSMPGQGPQPPPPGMPSQPQAGPRPMPMPGATPMPPGMGGGPPPGAPPPMQGGAPPMGPPPGAPPPAPAAPPQNSSLSGVAQPTGQGLIPDTQKTMQSIIQSIAKANPNLPKNVLFEAANQQIAMMHGLDADSRIYMQAAISQAKIQEDMQKAVLNAQSHADALDAKIKAQEEQLKIAVAAKEALQAEKDKAAGERNRETVGGRVQAAGIGASARRDAAQIGATSRENVAGTQAGARRDAAQIGADSRRDVAGTGAQARTDAARIGMGEKVPRGSVPLGKPQAAPVYPLPAAGKYKSAEAVGKDYQAGKLTREQAKGILARDFGMK